MTDYFNYLREFLIRFWTDFVRFFSKRIVSPWEDVGGNFEYYHALLSQYSGGFGFAGWFFFVLFMVLFVALIGAVFFGLYLLLRKYIRFVKKEIDKDELREQVERLNYELYMSRSGKRQDLQYQDRLYGLIHRYQHPGHR